MSMGGPVTVGDVAGAVETKYPDDFVTTLNANLSVYDWDSVVIVNGDIAGGDLLFVSFEATGTGAALTRFTIHVASDLSIHGGGRNIYFLAAAGTIEVGLVLTGTRFKAEHTAGPV